MVIDSYIINFITFYFPIIFACYLHIDIDQ